MIWTLRETELRYRKGVRVTGERRVSSSVVVNSLVHDTDEQIRCASGIEERVIALTLDAKNNVTGWHLVGKGGISECSVEPGAVFRAALMAGASGIVLVHNHPSGDPHPSAEDIALTTRVVRGGELLGVRVVDHVIVTADPAVYFSFLDAGLLGSSR